MKTVTVWLCDRCGHYKAFYDPDRPHHPMGIHFKRVAVCAPCNGRRRKAGEDVPIMTKLEFDVELGLQ